MIKIKGVNKSYGNTLAVSDLTITVKSGECFGFLGPNGAGKTTTIKMVAGLLRPDSGTIELDSVNIQKEPEKAKKILGYIPDKPFLYEKLTAGEYLEFIAEIYEVEHREFVERKKRFLQMFSLASKEDELIESFSHGMRQKLVFTSALIHSPKVIVVDEPMVGLDPKGAKQVKELFVELTSAGTTIFMSTHTLSTAEETCTRLCIIDRGRVLATGSMDDLKRETSLQNTSDLEEVFLKFTGSSSA